MPGQRTDLPTFEGAPNCVRAHQYAADVVDGRIPAGKHTIAACQRQLDDLAREDWEYRFDPAKAERVCRFMQLLPHVRGQLRGKPLVLQPWQAFIVTAIFGWVSKETGRRRFREAYIEVARKNGKSFLAAAIGLYMLCADDEPGAEVFAGATTEKQAWAVFRPAQQVAKQLPELCEFYGVTPWKAHIEHDDGGWMKPMIGRPGDGDNPHCALIDEFHEHASSDQYDTMRTGMGAREHPLILITTTAGYDMGGPCYTMHLDLAAALEDPDRRDERVFSLIYHPDEGDDMYALGSLEKANPNLGVSVKGDYLIAQAEAARRSPRQQTAYFTKHLNTWVGAHSTWLSIADWMSAEDESLTIDRFAGQQAIYALDMATKLDFCACVRLFREERSDGWHWYIFPHFWLSEDRVHEEETGRYLQWFQQGLIDTTEGKEVQFDYVEDCLLRMAEANPPEELAYDPFSANYLAQRLENAGLPVVGFQATRRNFSEPMHTFEAALRSGRVHVPANPIMRWMAGNLVAKRHQDDTIFPTKERREAKIDGMIAALMAAARSLELQQGNGLDAWLSSLASERSGNG